MPAPYEYVKDSPGTTKVSWRRFTESGPVGIGASVVYQTDKHLGGTRNPNWKIAIAKGRSATTPLSASERSIELREGELGGGWYTGTNPAHIPANYREDVGFGNETVSMSFAGDPSLLSTNMANEVALRQLWQNIIAARNSMQLGTFIGELRQTIGMVRNRGHSMMGLLTRWNDHLRRSKRYRRTREDRRKEAADAHLEWSFGMKPLISDINAGLQIWSEPARLQKRVKGKAEIKNKGPLGTSSTVDVGIARCRRQAFAGSTVGIMYGAAVSAQIAGTKGYLGRLGLLPHDFIPTLYNLLPWSFLLDYVSTVGDCIEALNFPTSHIVYAWRTTRLETWNEYTTAFESIRPDTKPADVVYTRTKPCYAKTSRKVVTRAIIENIGMPALRFKIPGRAGQWVNMAALAAARSFKYWP
jgi:hypothetical protein